MKSLHQMQSTEQEDLDPCSILMEVALYDEGNPIMDWLCNSRSESVPTLDEYDGSEPESPNNPSTFLVEELGMNEEELATFKKKLDFGKKGGNKRKVVSEEDIEDYFESDSDKQGSPTYAESGDSSSDDCEDSNGGQPSRGEDSNGGQAGNIVFFLSREHYLSTMLGISDHKYVGSMDSLCADLLKLQAKFSS
jgi:hypothetical protein